MSVKSTLAKKLPESIARKGIAKGSHRGDNWVTVSTIIQAMCEMRPTDDGYDFVYNGKVIGWAKNNGTNWCDDSAYVKMREEYNNKHPQQSALEASKDSDCAYDYAYDDDYDE